MVAQLSCRAQKAATWGPQMGCEVRTNGGGKRDGWRTEIELSTSLECSKHKPEWTPLFKWYWVKLPSVRSMFYGLTFKTATLGQFLEIFILICLISHSHVIFERLLSTVHEVPTTPPCALTPPSVLLQKKAVKSQAGSSGYFICPDHLCKKTDEINERGCQCLRRSNIPQS